MRDRILTIESITWSEHQLVMRFSLDELAFSTVYWYPDTDLLGLERRFGRGLVERMFVHAALFEVNKIASLRPRILDLGSYARYHTVALERLWTTVFHKVWAQWRYENDLPHEGPPRWASAAVADGKRPGCRDRDAGEMLLFCGGGSHRLGLWRAVGVELDLAGVAAFIIQAGAGGDGLVDAEVLGEGCHDLLG